MRGSRDNRDFLPVCKGHDENAWVISLRHGRYWAWCRQKVLHCAETGGSLALSGGRPVSSLPANSTIRRKSFLQSRDELLGPEVDDEHILEIRPKTIGEGLVVGVNQVGIPILGTGKSQDETVGEALIQVLWTDVRPGLI